MTASETLARRLYDVGYKACVKHKPILKPRGWDAQSGAYLAAWLAIARWVMARERKICRDRKPVTKKP